METGIIEPVAELRLTIVPAPDDPPLSSEEYQTILRDFHQELKSHGLEVSSRWYTHDAVGSGGGFVGEFVLAAAVLAPLIKELRKLLETILDARHGRKVKIQIGILRLECSAGDVDKTLQQLTSSDQFQKLLESGTQKKKTPRPLSA
jgi:hypothetical protein